MPKVKITNLKPGACVINSLKITIAGGSSITRDASVVGDSDLTELESYGIVSVTPLEDIPQAQPAAPKTAAPKPAAVKPAQPPQAPKKTGAAKQGAAKQGKAPQQPPQPPPPPSRPGTDFRAVDGPEDQMGGKVVVVGEAGPEVKKMTGGINAHNGPKYAGDTSWEDENQEGPDGSGFTTV